MIKYKCGKSAKINDKISYISFGKNQLGLVKKIVETDFKELKVYPISNHFRTSLSAVMAKNATLVERSK